VARPPDGRPPKILTVTDEHTRESLGVSAAREMGADDTVSALERIVERRGTAPELIRRDNGSEFIAHALRDCAASPALRLATSSPEHRGRIPTRILQRPPTRRAARMESFNSLYEAQLLLEDGDLSTTTTDHTNP
jgi:putative transposase